MKTTLTAAAALAAAMIAAPALAQPVSVAPSNYIQANIGAGFAGRANVDVNLTGANTASGSDNVDLDTGLFLSAAAGHAFGNGLAVELEGIYAHNKVDNNNDINSVLGTDFRANSRTWGGLVNAKYEFPTQWHGVAPYVGGGVGYGDIRIKIRDLGHDSDSGFMWQAKAGLAFPMNDRLTWDVGYRYLAQPDYNKSATVDGTTGRFDISSHVHVVSVGARMTF